MKKTYLLVAIENILLTIVKYLVLFLSFFAAYNGSYVIPPSNSEQLLLVSYGIVGIIVIDLIINYIIYRILKKRIKYLSLILISLCNSFGLIIYFILN